jgi:hypothetical protein
LPPQNDADTISPGCQLVAKRNLATSSG